MSTDNRALITRLRFVGEQKGWPLLIDAADALKAAEPTTTPTDEQFNLAIALVRAEGEIVRLTEERDRYAAVIAELKRLEDWSHSPDWPGWNALNSVWTIIRRAPTATLTARDARKWWEGITAQWTHRPIGNRISEFKNPYCTPQQGDTE